MTLLQYLFNDLDNLRPSHNIIVPMESETLFRPYTIPSKKRILVRSRPKCDFNLQRITTSQNISKQAVQFDDDKFQVNLDVQQFKPEEITVKVTEKNEVTIEGKHEEKEDEHGFISRHFVRKYHIPEGHDLNKIVSHLSSDGVLSISAPKINVDAVGHREIPIVKTGQPAVIKRKRKSEEKLES